MVPYIGSAVKNIRSIVNEVTSKGTVSVRFALVKYRDHPPEVSMDIYVE